jgi:hypothetical protein
MSYPTWPGLFPETTEQNISTYLFADNTNGTHPQPTEVMNDGDVHHGAERTTHIRPVHGIMV